VSFQQTGHDSVIGSSISAVSRTDAATGDSTGIGTGDATDARIDDSNDDCLFRLMK